MTSQPQPHPYSITNDDNFHNLGISFIQYQLLKKYSLGESLTFALYKAMKANISIHRVLTKTFANKHINKKEKSMNLFSKVALPYTNIQLSDLTPVKSKKNPDNFTQTISILKHIPKCLKKPVIINFYSSIGDSSLKATSYCYEQLTQAKVKGTVITGVELNDLSVDFEDGNSFNHLLTNDFLIINAINSIFVTDYRKNYLNNLLLSAKLKNIPIIISSNTQVSYPEFDVINLELKDNKKNQLELIKELLGEDFKE